MMMMTNDKMWYMSLKDCHLGFWDEDCLCVPFAMGDVKKQLVLKEL